ncbi:MAG: ABC transporter substrate-binding protein [Spirochaetales bacterium]|nr:ABC transporter substrate-binding protein [Spirochaetales bacterium]MCF7937400.1 ABC transporter substrate-binding protein [Spirochaetales bacterium]
MRTTKHGLHRGLLIALTLFVVLSMAVFAGGQQEGAGQAEGGAEQAEPVRMTAGFTQEESLETLSPTDAWQYGEMGCMFWPLVYDQLWIMGPGPDYEAIPALAKSWETEDNQTWTFHLREGVEFHDGEEVTAEDVEFTLEYFVHSDPVWEYQEVMTTDIQVIDKYTIQFTLEEPHGGAGGKYPPGFWTPIVPKHIFEPVKDSIPSYPNEEAIGSGPFQLKEFKSGEFVWLEKNEDWWGEGPYVDEVVFRMFGSEDARDMALKRGDIDMIGYAGVDPVSAKQFEGLDNIEILTAGGLQIPWVTFNLHNDTPIQDLAVRQAIMYAINKQRIADIVYLGYAERVYGFIYPEMSEFNPNVKRYNYDVDKAKEVLAGAGYTDTDGNGVLNDPETGEDLEFEGPINSQKTYMIKTMRLISEDLAEIGIKINVKPTDQSTLLDYLYDPVSDNYTISLIDEEPGPYADWVWEFARSYENGGEGWNTAYYNSEEFDSHLKALLSADTLEERKEHSYAMQRILSEDLPFGFLVRPEAIDPVRTDNVTGYVEAMGISNWINPWSYIKAKPVE